MLDPSAQFTELGQLGLSRESAFACGCWVRSAPGEAGLTPVDEPHGGCRWYRRETTSADEGNSMRGIAGERGARCLMEGEKARRQVDVVFGIGNGLSWGPQAASDLWWRTDEMRRIS